MPNQAGFATSTEAWGRDVIVPEQVGRRGASREDPRSMAGTNIATGTPILKFADMGDGCDRGFSCTDDYEGIGVCMVPWSDMVGS